jgi:uncharacterized cupin superfamily protein
MYSVTTILPISFSFRCSGVRGEDRRGPRNSSTVRCTRRGGTAVFTVVVAESEGWFVVGLRDAGWRHAASRGAVCVAVDDFEGARRPLQLGLNPFVLEPGEPMSMYHWETDQEDFLVISGEAVLIVEGEERRLRAWDFFHCPPNTKHAIVGAGSGPCVVIAAGARRHSDEPHSLGFPVDDVAKRYDASVEEETMDGGAAYASAPDRVPAAYRAGWLP